MNAVWEALHIGFGLFVAGAGIVVVIGGVLGIVRFPDVYARVHAATAAHGIGAALAFLGLAIMAWEWALSARFVLLAALSYALGPLLAHLVAASAHASGLASGAADEDAVRNPKRGATP